MDEKNRRKLFSSYFLYRMFVLFFWFACFYYLYDLFERKNTLEVMDFVVGAIVYLIFSVALKCIVLDIIGPGYFKTLYIKDLVSYKLAFSFDLSLSHLFKLSIDNSDSHFLMKGEDKSSLILGFNVINLAFSGMVLFIVFIASLIEDSGFVLCVFGLVFYRTFSRSIEIIYAFIMDVINRGGSSTFLDKFDRLKLAMNSYVENVLNYSCFYAIYGMYIGGASSDKPIVDYFLDSLGRSTISHVNASNCDYFINLAILTQVVTSLSLAVLSLAIYVGRKK